MSRGKWIATPEVYDATGAEITIGDIGLPHGLDSERIQFNVDALRRGVISWGGYAALVLGSRAGERDKIAPHVSGVNEDGSITGVSSRTERAELATSSSDQNTLLERLNVRNGTLYVKLNSTVLNDRATLEEQFDPAFKARQLNRALKKPIIHAVTKHSTSGRLRVSNPFGVALDGMLLSSSVMSYVERDPSLFISLLLLNMTGQKGVIPLMNKNSYGVPYGDTVTDPVFVSMRPTRAIMAAGTLASQRLVRATPLKSES